MLEAEGVDDRRGHRRAGHLVDRAHDHRPVEPRGHHADDDAPRRRLRRRPRSRSFVRAARGRARSAAGRDRRPHRAAPEPRQRGRRAARRSPSTCATPTTRVLAEAERRLLGVLRRARATRRRDDRAPFARALRAGRLRRRRDRAGRGGRARARATRRCACRRAPGTTRRCSPACARPGWCSCRACAASATIPPSSPHDADLEAGANVLLHVLLRLAGATMTPGRSTVAAAQMGPVARAEPRDDGRRARCSRCCARRPAAARELVVFPELALTTFFPRWDLADDEVLDVLRARDAGPGDAAAVRRSARGSASASTSATPSSRPTATATTRRSSSSATAASSTTYRKVHLPGHEEPEPWRPFQHLERKYFEPGPGGFRVHRRVRRRGRHRDLQRPALARDVPRARPAGRRADLHRLQHADPLRARSRRRIASPGSTTTS